METQESSLNTQAKVIILCYYIKGEIFRIVENPWMLLNPVVASLQI